MLQAINISKWFGYKHVLKEINLVVNPGDSIAIFGPNGSGKTTLIEILSSLIKPSSGKLIIAGIDSLKYPYKVRPLIGYLGHEPMFYVDLTPYENLMFFAKMYGIKQAEKQIEELLKLIGLTHLAHESINLFSHGMIKRLMLARALVNQPKILLMDEPFTGLDPSAIQIILDIIKSEKKKGTCIVLTTHNRELGKQVSTELRLLLGGKLKEIETEGKNSWDFSFGSQDNEQLKGLRK